MIYQLIFNYLMIFIFSESFIDNILNCLLFIVYFCLYNVLVDHILIYYILITPKIFPLNSNLNSYCFELGLLNNIHFFLLILNYIPLMIELIC